MSVRETLNGVSSAGSCRLQHSSCYSSTPPLHPASLLRSCSFPPSPPALAPAPLQIIAEPLSRRAISDPEIFPWLRAEVPLVLTDTYLVDTAVHSWSLPYLRRSVDPGAAHTVRSTSRTLLFSAAEGGKSSSSSGAAAKSAASSSSSSFSSFVKSRDATFGEFVDELTASVAAADGGRRPFAPLAPAAAPALTALGAIDDAQPASLLELLYPGQAGPLHTTAAATAASSSSSLAPGCQLLAPPASATAHSAVNPAPTTGSLTPRPLVALQEPLVVGLGPAVLSDYNGFAWGLLSTMRQRLGWGAFFSNSLQILQRGVTLPLHYDEMHNLLAVAGGGRVLVLLASPAAFGGLYPFPLDHACDRQAQVDIRAPDTARFPGFSRVKWHYALLSPGDVLYIPPYWWHYEESPECEASLLNFWHRKPPPSAPELPLRDPAQRMALRRNLEKLAGQSLGGEGGAFFAAIAAGAPLSPAQEGVKAHLLTLLGQVIAAEECGDFLAGIAAGRF